MEPRVTLPPPSWDAISQELAAIAAESDPELLEQEIGELRACRAAERNQ